MDGADVSGLVAVVAWAALAGWIAAGVLLVLAHRRIEHLEREHTARKWDIVALRAELRALHRPPEEDPSGPAAVDPAPPVTPDPPPPRRPAGDPGPRPGDPVPRPVDGGARSAGPTRTAGATAWRRAHRRPASGTRRRPS